jgi:hypothetical protein
MDIFCVYSCQKFGWKYHMILDTRYSILDDILTVLQMQIIEYRVSSIIE